MIQKKNIDTNIDTQGVDLINILKGINISAFLDSWGPVHVLHVYDPDINMQGILVIDNISLGPGCGGIKIYPHITPYDIFHLARKMTWIHALADVKLGGAAAGIKANPLEIDRIKFIKSFANAVSPYVPYRYIAAPYLYTGMDEMSAFVEEVGDRRGATGKPESMGGIPYELGVIGFGMSVVIEESLEAVGSSFGLPTNISETNIAIPCFDDIGRALAKYLVNKNANIVAISDEECMIYNPKGIDTNEIINHTSATTAKHSLKNSKGIKKLPKEDIIKVDCDVLVLTTGNKLLTDKNTEYLKAKCVVEGVNNPVTGIADQILHKKGILVLPDILTTTGGAISSYAEYNGNSRERAFSLIESKTKETTRYVVQHSLESGIPLRRVAQEIAKERILQAMEGEQ